jgi:succinate dehydrogenase hydrophobic anchor subunit
LWLAFYILLLIFGLYHGLHGLRTIIIELLPRLPAKVVDRTLVTVGVAIFIYAAYIPISAF